MTYRLRILINDGHLFDGSLEQWEDCFFTLPSDHGKAIVQILGFCAGLKAKVELHYTLPIPASKCLGVYKYAYQSGKRDRNLYSGMVSR